MKKISLTFLFAFFISSNCLASETSSNLKFSPHFYGSLGLDHSKAKISKNSDIFANKKGNNAFGGTFSLGLQQNLPHNLYINAELFYSTSNSKITENKNLIKINSNYGFLTRFGYKFANDISVYLGSGFGYLHYNIDNSQKHESKYLKNGIFALGVSKNIAKNIEAYFDAKYFKTQQFTFLSGNASKGRLEYSTYSAGIRMFFN